MNIEENGVSRPITKDDLSKVIAAFDIQTSSGSRFSDPAKVLREAEAFCEDADSVDEDDRIHEQHMCLALWDELRNLRRENARLNEERNNWRISSVARELDAENTKLRECGNALRDALAFEGVKIGDLPREIKEWDTLVSALPNV